MISRDNCAHITIKTITRQHQIRTKINRQFTQKKRQDIALGRAGLESSLSINDFLKRRSRSKNERPLFTIRSLRLAR